MVSKKKSLSQTNQEKGEKKSYLTPKRVTSQSLHTGWEDRLSMVQNRSPKAGLGWKFPTSSPAEHPDGSSATHTYLFLLPMGAKIASGSTAARAGCQGSWILKIVPPLPSISFWQYILSLSKWFLNANLDNLQSLSRILVKRASCLNISPYHADDIFTTWRWCCFAIFKKCDQILLCHCCVSFYLTNLSLKTHKIIQIRTNTE